MHSEQLAADFAQYADLKLAQHLAQIARCVALLNHERLWERENAHANSVGNLLLHLTGNVRQWIVAGIGGEPFGRDRPAEFAARGGRSGAELLAELERTVAQAREIIRGADADRLRGSLSIQGYTVTGLRAIFHVVEHFSFHTGQIVHITKVLKDVDLSSYDAQGQRAPDAPQVP
jgi:uncharacterized damage-inducible protein DinB